MTMTTCRALRRVRAVVRPLALALVIQFAVGCAALTNPGAEGVPARLVPPELLAPSKKNEKQVPLSLLRQTPPAKYLLDTGDVLGVYVEDYLGSKATPVPVHVGSLVQARDQHRQSASAGYPVPVSPDGTIALPAVGNLPLRGKTIEEAAVAIREAYIKKDLVKPEAARVLVSLMEPRQHTVLVLRQEAQQFAGVPESVFAASKKGAGFEVQLPAYHNDVLHALTRTGGLPGLDTFNEVVIYRSGYQSTTEGNAVIENFAHKPDQAPALLHSTITRIPLRYAPHQEPCIATQDIVLQTGDVVFLPARDEEVFFTGGLLPTGIHNLPRDRDLDALEAVSLVRGPLINGAFGGSNLSGALIQPGIGNPSPGLLTVVRKTKDGGQISIVVDLAIALKEPTERIRIQAGDMLILQESPGQALARYVSQTLVNISGTWQAIQSPLFNGFLTFGGPERLPNSGTTINLNR